ncbi:Pyrrolo-quinoline quinone coenzyme N-terminus [Terriglobus roseus DSM 18391]|uniref:Pyrrolo-quinoline quinone coenzyme N-terminus n=1 Tax=Terriglobus roseus (strain DSM 18391 / NRRL B-41598 / KBS 63) TaxID=926566 RepID=I3ZK54_TERRK|nr:PQQ-binding-like beta-propeller repeat protein [Terriglobus roseus]AFL89622.1 Pyrrolo-quinoline quinone coenzyme N-terminus [Terriglobus roseus DSM 18391]
MRKLSTQKTLSALASAALFCSGLALFSSAAVAQNGNWLTSGGDVQRSGWNKDEKTLNKSNVGNMKLLWKTKTDVYPHGLHTLMDPLVVQNVPTPSGPKEMVYILGVGDTLYAFDAKSGTIAWQKQFKYEVPPPARPPDGAPARPAQVLPTDTRHYNFLNPGGSTDVPVIGEPDAKGVRPIYVLDGGGNLHVLSDVTGEDLKPEIKTGATSKFALQLWNNSIVYAGRGGIYSVELATGKVIPSKGFGGGGGLWGRRGPVITSDGVVWTTTGDGIYDPSKPNNLVLGNSVVGFELKDGAWQVKDWFTPPNWDWLRRRDLDPNNTPTSFMFKGKEYMAASGKECRLYLLDPANMGGPDHHEPLLKTPLICNEAVDFASAGSWGAVSSYLDAKGTRWVLVPFWGPKHSGIKFPIENAPATKEGGVAAFKLIEKDGKPAYEPVWVSRDMFRGEPPIVANGVVYTWGSGDDTQQVWPDIGLNFDSSNRAALSNHVTVFALDAETGKELWSSKEIITSFNHFTGITVANGKVYMSSYDGNVYCFGL